jgi:hypothetical protein
MLSPVAKFITQLEELKVCDKSTLTKTVCEKTSHVSFYRCKIVYRIVLESSSIFYCFSDIMSDLYLCIWHHYKDKFIMLSEKIPLLHLLTFFL